MNFQKQIEDLTRQISTLQPICDSLNPSKELLEQQTKQVTEYCLNTLENVSQQNIVLGSKTKFTYEEQEELKVGGSNNSECSMEQLIQKLDKYVNKSGISHIHGGFMAYICGGGIPVAALGDYVGAILNKFTSIRTMSPGCFEIEKSLIQWTANMLGFSQNFGGNFTTGGSQSNLYAIISAREKFQLRGKDYEKTVIYTTSQTHLSNDKAILVAGLKECIVRHIEIDEKFRMNSEKLENQIKHDIINGLQPFLVIAQAGSTNIGAIDPLESIAIICQTYDIWMHVDGAYGGYFMLTEKGKQKMKGIEYADSVTLDPHKSLFMPFGLGLIIVKDQANLQRPFKRHNNLAQSEENSTNLQSYIQDSINDEQEYPNQTDMSMELSRNFRSLKLWICLQLYGESVFTAQLNQKLYLAQYVYYKLKLIDGLLSI